MRWCFISELNLFVAVAARNGPRSMLITLINHFKVKPDPDFDAQLFARTLVRTNLTQTTALSAFVRRRKMMAKTYSTKYLLFATIWALAKTFLFIATINQ